VSGQIIITDVDSTPGIFGNGTLAGTYGSFTYNSAGAWTYTLDNADPDTDLLDTGQTVQDTFSLFTAGLTPFNVTIDINGADEPPGATPWSDLFQVNVMDAGPSGDDQFEPVSIQLKNGDIVVLWVDLSGAAPGDAPSRDIVGQVFDPLGNRIGSEFLANAGFSDRNEGDFSAAALDNGGFVVTYVDVGTFPGVTNVIHATEWATNADGTVGASQARTIFASTDPTVRATSEQHVTSQPGGGYVVTFLTGNLTTFEVTANLVAVDSDGSAAAPVSLPLSRVFELGLDFASASMPNGNLAVLLQSQGNSADTIDLWIGTTDGITIAQSTIVTLGAVALR
ncbi:MAG: VCBS domain-containing protein, partial [Pseudomonadota bacterium]